MSMIFFKKTGPFFKILCYLYPHNTLSILILFFHNLTKHIKYQLSNLGTNLGLVIKGTVNPPTAITKIKNRSKFTIFDKQKYIYLKTNQIVYGMVQPFWEKSELEKK